MTTLSRSFRHSDPARVIDVRCSAKLAFWMFGFPVPAWFEAEAAPELTG